MKIIRLLAGWPFSLLYGLLVKCRNALYLRGIIKRESFDVTLISVGNLIAGGSGKTPMVIFLIEKLADSKKVGVLSRGYGRKSSGFFWVESDSSPQLTGDEPLMIKYRHPETAVAVCESRVEGVKRMLSERPDLELIILDDAFQHLHIRPQFNILLTAYNRPFTEDFPLPAGMLREFRSGSKRADMVVVTKCPLLPAQHEETEWRKKLKLREKQGLFFALYQNSAFIPVKGSLNEEAPSILITGIANPESLFEYVNSKVQLSKHYRFKDHYAYDRSTFESIKQSFTGEINVITTEKDLVKWHPFMEILSSWNILIVKVDVQINHDERFLEYLKF